jgi:hypothetical protein
MEVTDMPDNLSAVDTEFSSQLIDDVLLPRIVIAIAEDNVVRPHLNYGYQLIVTNHILYCIGAHEV